MAQVTYDEDALAAFCHRHHIRRLSLFGSAVKGEFRPDSDVDVLAAFEDGHTPGFFALFDLEEELSHIFGGRPVDLKTKDDLGAWIRGRVLEEAEVQYAAP